MTDSMMALAQATVNQALKAGADYADVRVSRCSQEQMVLRNGVLAEADAPEDFGMGVRVLKNGCWGFAAAPGRPSELGDVAPGLARRAFKAARDLAPVRHEPVELAGVEGHVGEYVTPMEQDPFRVSLNEKLDILRAADAGMRGAESVVVREASLSLRRTEQWQASSEGAAIHQVQVRTGAGIAVTAAANGTVERRSYPASFGGQYQARGFELVHEMDLAGNAERIRDEAVALCSAPLCPAGERTLILGGSQLMLQIHESVGHPSELDRAMGSEVDLAGASFLTTDKLGTFQFGSPQVTLTADSTIAGGLDTRGYDDECVPSGRWPIVDRGQFVGYHTNREWAQTIDEPASRGTARGTGWFSPPIVRITNLSLEPGDWKLDALLADTEDGAIFADGVRTWSIDQRRVNFQFTCEVAYEIQGGRLGRMLRQPTYQGQSTNFWRSCDAVCGPEEWQLWGVPNCGKGNPMQVAEMSHGAAPARFRGVSFL
ncbi:MAG: TldD protein [Planctomycetota bacterium]|jgi:TldD protein